MSLTIHPTTLFLLLLLSALTRAQQPGSHPAIRELYREKGTVAYVHCPEEENLLDPAHPLSGSRQLLVRAGNGLFLSIDGTGTLFRADSTADGLHWTRVDSTKHTGYNHDAFVFPYRDSLYSLGGYGFWRTNGHLRVYLPSIHEWGILKVNRELPLRTSNSFGWLSPADHSYWVALTSVSNEAEWENEEKKAASFSVYRLDLASRKWARMGVLNRLGLSGFTPVAHTPWGTLGLKDEHFYLLDFRGNSFRPLNAEKTQKLMHQLVPHLDESVVYCKDSILKWSWKTSANLFTLVLHEGDFEKGPEIFQQEANAYAPASLLWATGGIALASFLAFLYLYMRRRRGRQVVTEAPVLLPRQESQWAQLRVHLTPVEMEFVSLVAQNTVEGRVTTIDEINVVLGIRSKSADLQKKHRSDLIISINRKFDYLNNTDTGLVQKQRAEGDKRSFTYFMDLSRARAWQQLQEEERISEE